MQKKRNTVRGEKRTRSLRKSENFLLRPKGTLVKMEQMTETNVKKKCPECGTELNAETVEVVGTAVYHGKPYIFKGKLEVDWPDKPYQRFSIECRECGYILKEVHELDFMQELRALLGTE